MRKQDFRLKTIVLLVACIFCIGCGTLGGIGDTINFPISKKKLEIALDSLFAKHPEYKVPDKWIYEDSSMINSYYFLESRTFYFKNDPEEMYYVSFIGDSTMLADTTHIGIAIRAINNGTSKWLLNDTLASEEKKRIVKRFDNEIVSKLEKYTKTKAYKESP